MQTSIGPTHLIPRKPRYEDISKVARIYLSQSPSRDADMERWLQTQRELLKSVSSADHKLPPENSQFPWPK